MAIFYKTVAPYAGGKGNLKEVKDFISIAKKAKGEIRVKTFDPSVLVFLMSEKKAVKAGRKLVVMANKKLLVNEAICQLIDAASKKEVIPKECSKLLSHKASRK